LSINGGTAPYTILWSNGQQGKILNNLLPGTYSAIVIDYYGDLTENVECVVGFSNPLPSMTPTPTLTPTPTPAVQPILCLSDGINVNYTFYPNGFDLNNNYIWTGSSLTMSFDIINNRWTITPWVLGGVMIQSTNLQIPIGTWVNLGVIQDKNWNVTLGECEETFPLQLQITKTDETCDQCFDGTVYLSTTGGVPPYQYRIYGFGSFPSYQSVGLFSGLYSGTYTAEVIDDNGNTLLGTFIINNS
jgi:hypothetical protein